MFSLESSVEANGDGALRWKHNGRLVANQLSFFYLSNSMPKDQLQATNFKTFNGNVPNHKSLSVSMETGRCLTFKDQGSHSNQIYIFHYFSILFKETFKGHFPFYFGTKSGRLTTNLNPRNQATWVNWVINWFIWSISCLSREGCWGRWRNWGPVANFTTPFTTLISIRHTIPPSAVCTNNSISSMPWAARCYNINQHWMPVHDAQLFKLWGHKCVMGMF